MNRDNRSFWKRRSILQAAGVSVTATVGLQHASTVRAQNNDASVSIEDQESDGTSLVISAKTEDEARLIIFSGEETDGFEPQYRRMTLEPGTEFSDRTITLDRYIFESKQVGVTIQSNRNRLAQDEGFVEVDDSYPIDMTVEEPDIEYVLPPSDAEFYHPYVLYTPSVSDGEGVSDTRPLFVERGQPPINDVERIAGNAVNNLRRGGRWRREMAEEFGVPYLIPAFPGLYRPLAPSNMDLIDYHSLVADDTRHVRYDLQLLAMIEDAKERLTTEPYAISDKIHIHGSSSSATFASRFAILHPERVAAVSAGTTAQHPLPKETVDDDVPVVTQPDNETLLYPAGVGDLDELIGREFNSDAWKEIGKFFWMGGDDQGSRSFVNLPDERKEQVNDVFGTDRVEERFPVTQSVYQAVDPSAQFTIYEGWGHTTEPAVDDIMEFHLSRLNYDPTDEDEGDSTVDDDADDETSGESANEEEQDSESTQTEEDETVSGEENETTPANETDDEVPGLGTVSALAGIGSVVAYGILSPDGTNSEE